MKKVDFKKTLKELYNAPKEPVLVNVPPMNFLMVDGVGDPNTSMEAKDAIEALYPVAYSLKFMIKKEQSIDYGVLPLEGLWWTDDMNQFSVENKDIWKFTYMIMQPEYVTRELVDRALEEVKRKKKLAAIDKVRFERLEEGTVSQIMHTGPYAEEGPTIAKLHGFIAEKGFRFDGLAQKHHEIYLSDFRKTAPEKLKTVLRQPVVK